MVNEVLDRIDARLAKLGKKRRWASITAGLGPDYIRDLDRLKTASPTIMAISALATVLETTIVWLIEGTGPEEIEVEHSLNNLTVPVWGECGAGGKVGRFHIDDGPLEFLPSREGWGPNKAAVKIRGESLGRLFDQWYAVYDEVRDPPTDDLIGELCICETSEGLVYIKRLKKYRGNRWTLESNVEAPIINVSIRWAAIVTGIVRR